VSKLADMEDMLIWAAFESSWDLIQSKMSEKDLKDLFQDLWHECDFKEEVVEQLLSDEGFVDHEQVRADYEDQKYQEWKDRDID
tara:strand:- start:142 stop:393 length:252 start_codon:yes stop_codon:yes gene_type:complete